MRLNNVGLWTVVALVLGGGAWLLLRSAAKGPADGAFLPGAATERQLEPQLGATADLRKVETASRRDAVAPTDTGKLPGAGSRRTAPGKGFLTVALAPPPHPAIASSPRPSSKAIVDSGAIRYGAPPGLSLRLYLKVDGQRTSPIDPDAEDTSRWSDLDAGTYDLQAHVTGDAGERDVWLLDLVVPETGSCADGRLGRWDPYRYLPIMYLTVRSDTGEALTMPEVVLVGDAGSKVYRFDVREGLPWVVIEPGPGEGASDGASDRVLVVAGGHGEQSLPFQRGSVGVDLLQKVSPNIFWLTESGEGITEGFVTISRVSPPGERLRPLTMQLDLGVALGMRDRGYRPAMPLPRDATYRVTEENDLFDPVEFTLPAERMPRFEVTLRAPAEDR